MDVTLKKDCSLVCWSGLTETHVQFSTGDTFQDVKECEDLDLYYVKEGDENHGDILIPKDVV